MDNLDISGMSDSDRGELQKFLKSAEQQASINKIVSKLTDTCWTACIKTPITQGSLSSSEEACASNCVARWLESQNTVLKTLSESEAKKRRF